MEKILQENKQWIDQTWQKLDTKLSRTAIKSRDKIPYSSQNGVHDNQMEILPKHWCNGFWGGLMWLMYIDTKKKCTARPPNAPRSLWTKCSDFLMTSSMM